MLLFKADLMKSMTGYGRGEAQGCQYRVMVEMRSVNHRYLEISSRLPKQLNMLEEMLKKLVQAELHRGKVDIFLSLEQPGGKKVELTLDKELTIAYHNSLKQLAALTELPLTLSAQDFATLPGVLTPEALADDVEEIALLAAAALKEALTQLMQMRGREGQNLQNDIASRIARLRFLTEEINALAPQLLLEQQQKLRKRIEELLADISVDEARLANEVAYLADKADINEELTRLHSHCEQAEAAFALDEPVGRRLDFLLQEMNREINTVGSKSNSLNISNLVIEMKSELEKIREQVQNIE